MKKNSKDEQLFLESTRIDRAKFIKMVFDLENDLESYNTSILDYHIAKNEFNYKGTPSLTIDLADDISELSDFSRQKSKPVKMIWTDFVERFGMLLMRFLNADFSNFYTAFNTFLFAYGVDDFININGKRTDMLTGFSYIDVLDWYECTRNLFSGYQTYFRRCVDYIYNLNGDNRDREYSHISKLRGFTIIEPNMTNLQNSYEVSFKSIVSKQIPANISLHQLSTRIENKDIEVKNVMEYNTSNGWFTLLYRTLELIVTRNTMPIKTCENDGKYFIPTHRIDEIYCDYKHLDGSTCKDVGAKKKYAQKAEQDPVISTYNKIYQVKIMRTRRNPDNKELKEQFENFKIRGTALKKAYFDGKINLDMYKKLMKIVEKDETNDTIEKYI